MTGNKKYIRVSNIEFGAKWRKCLILLIANGLDFMKDFWSSRTRCWSLASGKGTVWALKSLRM